ncbi:MAG: imidazoleglycerol-phosphate dehydratase HisB [Verrucomicrobiota bacterium]|jgi:imidazoleglycerol-phosphate dehydratase
MARTAQIHRKTGETDISIGLTIEGTGNGKITTRIPFFDHMLTLFARHGLFDLEVNAIGDIEVDFHHTVEDTGIALGQAFAKALGDKKGVRRYGWAYLPMDETLARVVIDFSGRPFLEHRVPSGVGSINGFPFQLVEEFMRAFSVHAGCNLHTEVLYGRDAHHMAEALFKGLAKAADQACQIDPRVTGIPSTKGVL